MSKRTLVEFEWQTNCLAWVMFDQALKDAEELDAYMKLHKKLKGPLHGLPISVKEHIYLKGTPSTSGFIAWANDFCEKDEDEALVLKVLREAGAVFYVKTTNPQSLMVSLLWHLEDEGLLMN